MSIELIAAEPTRAHGLAFAGYLEAAAGGAFALMLGSGFADVLATAYQQPGHDLSYEAVTFAVEADSILGMINAFSSEQHARSSTKPLTDAAGLRSLRMAAFVTAGYPLFRFLDQIPEGDLYVQTLAVDESRQGQGIGSSLLDHAEAQAVGARRARLSLHVDVRNTGAMRLYARHGLAIEATSGKAWLLGGEQVHRMAKTLT
jgi:ribosomal protein S18 acetylase RimI-like enzyme